MNVFRLSVLALAGFTAVACSHFKGQQPQGEQVAATETNVDRTIAQAGEGVSLSRISEGQSIKLPRCGGTAKLTRVNGELTLQVRNATCSNVKTAKGQWKLQGTEHGQRFINVKFTEDVPGDRFVLIGSNAYIDSRGADGNGDYITVRIAPKRVTLNLTETAQTKEINLEHCNGSIKASIANGSVNITVKNSGCSKFDIVSATGARVEYDTKSIPEVANEGGYTGNYTIPNRLYDRGLNGIVIRLSAPRLTEEQILVKFAAW